MDYLEKFKVRFLFYKIKPIFNSKGFYSSYFLMLLKKRMSWRCAMFLDMHVHTRFSDGKMSVKDVVNAAIRKKLRGIVVTDHDTLNGSLALMKYVRRRNLRILTFPGAEISTKDAHILIYNVFKIPRFETTVELIDKVHDENGIAAFAHPFGRLFLLKYPLVRNNEALRKIDAIECVNGRVPMISNLKALELAKKYSKPCIGGSDAHIPEEIGVAYTIVNEEISSFDDLLNAILKFKVRASGGRSFMEIARSIIIKRLRR